MEGYISSWNSGIGKIRRCPDETDGVFDFNLNGVIDKELAVWLQGSGPIDDLGPCPGNVPVQFVDKGGFAGDIRRLKAQAA